MFRSQIYKLDHPTKALYVQGWTSFNLTLYDTEVYWEEIQSDIVLLFIKYILYCGVIDYHSIIATTCEHQTLVEICRLQRDNTVPSFYIRHSYIPIIPG